MKNDSPRLAPGLADVLPAELFGRWNFALLELRSIADVVRTEVLFTASTGERFGMKDSELLMRMICEIPFVSK